MVPSRCWSDSQKLAQHFASTNLPDAGQAVRQDFLWAVNSSSRLELQRQLSTPPDRRPLPCPLHRPFCPNTDAARLPQHLRRPIFFSATDVAKRCFAANSICVCMCQPPSPPAKHPSLRPTRCLSSLYAHPLRRQCRPPVSIIRLPSSLLRTSCDFVRGAAGRRNVCSTVIHPISVHVQPLALRANLSCAPPQTGSLLQNGQPESTPVAN